MVPRWMHDAKTITSVSSILEGHRSTRLHIDHLQERQKNGQFSIKQTVSSSSTQEGATTLDAPALAPFWKVHNRRAQPHIVYLF